MHWEFSAAGKLAAPESAVIAPLLYGYGVYTTFVWPLSRTGFESHLGRLRRDAEQAGLACVFYSGLDKDRWADRLWDSLSENCLPEASVVRLSILADVVGYGDFFADSLLPCRVLVSFRPRPPAINKPLRLQSIRFEKHRPTIKWANLADSIYLRRQARQSGWDDILFTDGQGIIREASTANIVFIRQHCLYTPDPERDGCLPGITRARVLAAAQTAGVEVDLNTPITLSDLPSMEGAFLTNAVQGLVQVGAIDQCIFSWPETAQVLLHGLQTALAATGE